MKSLKLSIVALVFTIGIVGAFASTHVNRTATRTSALYWYDVDASGNTVGTPLYNDTKSNVIADQGCKDVAAKPICMFGSESASVPEGTPVGSPPASNRILRSN